MANRRGNQEGSITKRSKDSWRAQLYIQGKRLSYTAKSRKECQDWVKKTCMDSERGSFNPGATQTLEQYLESWLVTIKPSIRPGTHYQYTMTCRNYLLPMLGHLRLNQVRPNLIQQMYATYLNKGLGPRTVEVIHAVIHRALAQALKLELIDRNPVDATTPPRVEVKEMQIYDEVQVGQFLMAAKGDVNEALYQLAIATGLRQSELLGLKWSDLDTQKRTLNVQRQLRRCGIKGDLYTPPKTKNGRRTIVLGGTTLAKLQEHWWRQNEARIVAGDHWQENDLIFPTPTGTPKNQSNLFRQFKAMIEKAGLPEIRFHDLRHTAASLLLNHGVPAIIVSRRLGHYKVSMTLDIYGHLIPEMQDDAARLIDELITPTEIQLHHNCTKIQTTSNQTVFLPPHIEKDPQK
jgi:integrase